MPKYSKAFKRDYNRAFKRDPLAANLLLLITELADNKGQVQTNPAELAALMAARFEDPAAYQLKRKGGHRG